MGFSFHHDLIDEIVAGRKTKTRRMYREGDKVVFNEAAGYHAVVNANGRVRWIIGKDYAVVPGRGKPTVWYNTATLEVNPAEAIPRMGLAINPAWRPLRIKVLNLELGDVREISREDAICEGFSSPVDFLMRWETIYGSSGPRRLSNEFGDEWFAWWKGVKTNRHNWRVGKSQDFIDHLRKDCPDERFQAWAITFEVCQ
jgi:hypothetical protein